MTTVIAEFQIVHTRVLTPGGTLCADLSDWARDPERLLSLYRTMVLNRAFDRKAIALQRTGRLGTYAPTLGQEAIAAALGAVMHRDDMLVPFYCDTGTLLARGVMDFAGPREDFPINGRSVSIGPVNRPCRNRSKLTKLSAGG